MTIKRTVQTLFWSNGLLLVFALNCHGWDRDVLIVGAGVLFGMGLRLMDRL